MPQAPDEPAPASAPSTTVSRTGPTGAADGATPSLEARTPTSRSESAANSSRKSPRALPAVHRGASIAPEPLE